MLINTEYLKSLDPCQDRFENWLENYKYFNGSLKEFLTLDNISHEDKIWVYFRSIPKHLISLVAADFAEHVLHIFEDAFPEDKRPRLAIEAARLGDLNAATHAACAATYATCAASAATVQETAWKNSFKSKR